MAVPGHPMDARAGGGNLLIRDGAILVRDAQDVIDALGGPSAPRPDRVAPKAPARTETTPIPLPEGGLEGAILSLLGAAPVAEDQLIRDLGHPPRKIAQALAVLEMAGRISRAGGGLITRL
jgi:DNA processing protein